MHSLILLWDISSILGIMKMRSPLLVSRARMIGLVVAAAAATIMSILLAAANVTITNAQQQQQQQMTTTKIEKVWETPAELKTPESVIYEPNENVLFVSNIDGPPDRKDKQGFISKVSPLNGSIIELNWVTGLDAPKGMAIINSNDNNKLLYVSDITDLLEIDINSGKIINRYNAPGSAFLTDGASGKLYIVNSNGTGYETLDLQKQGTADLGIILDQDMIIIPMIQGNKLEAYRITD